MRPIVNECLGITSQLNREEFIWAMEMWWGKYAYTILFDKFKEQRVE